MSWLVYALLCLIFWGLWGLVLKVAYRDLNWVEVYFLSSLTSFIIALSIFLSSKVSIHFKPSALLAIIAGFMGGIGYVFFIKALEYGKASVVIALTALYPVITAILAFLVLNEKISITQAIGIALAVIAMILLSL